MFFPDRPRRSACCSSVPTLRRACAAATLTGRVRFSASAWRTRGGRRVRTAVGPVWSHVRGEDESTVTGFHLVSNWAPNRAIYFAARYSRPFDSFRIMRGTNQMRYDSFKTYRFRSSQEAAATNLEFIAEYK